MPNEQTILSENPVFDPGIRYSIVIIDSTLKPKVVALKSSRVTVGRAGFGQNIELMSSIASKEHGVFRLSNGQLQYTDLHTNRNGTYLNGAFLHASEADRTCTLHEGDILRIDSSDLSRPHSDGVLMIVTTTDQSREEWRTLALSRLRGEWIIGREPSMCQIVIPRINVSRQHARIFIGQGGALCVQDLHSLNHTLLNGRILTGTAALHERDVLNICSTKLIVTSGILLYNVPMGSPPVAQQGRQSSPAPDAKPEPSFIPQQGNAVTLYHLKRTVRDAASPKGVKTILDLSRLELTIQPGEMVAIIGGSGSGKTTLMNCMNAFEPANYGDVLINGNSLYKNRKAFRLQIGYVPQQDIVHDELTVSEMLTYAAKLRLPSGLSRQDVNAAIGATLRAVGLEAHANTMIRQLSGGQKKRSSIAAEMIADPAIFFLDEPTSGLDPEMEQSLITQLRAYAHNGGKTVVVVTHTLQSIKLFDKIIFLAPSVNGSGGQLAFFGSYEAALRFFRVDDIVLAYQKVTANPQLYVDRFLAGGAGR